MMNNTELIYKSLDVIEENIRSNITVCELSERFGFSFYYFSRLFKYITGFSPKTYMLNRKVTESVGDVLKSEKKIIEIAFDYGFSTPESYSRAFQKVIGINPSEVRKRNRLDSSLLFPPVTKERLTKSHMLQVREPELVEFGPVFLVGLSVYYETWDIKDLSDPWQYLTSNIPEIPGRIIPEKYYQVQSWFSHQDKEAISIFIALEVENINIIPMRFSAKMLPRQKYMKFFHKGFANKVGLTFKYIYEEWLPESEYRLPYCFNFEHYGSLYKGPYNEDSISEIYIPVE